MILTAALSNSLDARVNKNFFLEEKAHPKEFPNWCKEEGSSVQTERVAFYGELAQPNEVGEGQTIPEVIFPQGPMRTATHVKYGFCLKASKELIEDQLFKTLDRIATMMGRAMHHRIETEGAYWLNHAFDTYCVGNSSTANEYLCQRSHAALTGSGGSAQHNAPSADVTLGVDSAWAAIENFAVLKDSEGNPCLKIPRKIVAYATQFKVLSELLSAGNGVPYLSTNTKNILADMGFSFSLSHYATVNTAAWFMITDEKPVVFYTRRLPTVDSETNYDTDSKTWYMTTRIKAIPWDWMDMYGTDGVA